MNKIKQIDEALESLKCNMDLEKDVDNEESLHRFTMFLIKQGTLICEALEHYKAHQWADISTAPKDGTWVLLSGGKTDEDCYAGDEVNQERPITGFYEHGCGWAYDFWDGEWRSWYEKPTHWMPIPSAPKG